MLLLLLLLLDGEGTTLLDRSSKCLFFFKRNLCRQEIANCDGKFLGHRYADPSDPSLVKHEIYFISVFSQHCRHFYVDVTYLQVLIFDDAGYIAGVQSVLLESDVDLAVNDLTKQAGSLLDLEIGKRDFRKHG